MIYLSILILTLVLFVWFASVQNFNNKCDNVEYIKIDSGEPGPCLGIIAGVHGNEPAASQLLTDLLNSKNTLLKPTKGSIIVIPQANQCGLKNNTRSHPTFGFGYDLNRQFTEHGGINEKSKKIIEVLKNCDMILDFHEGWGWNITTRKKWGPTSLGSTLFATKHPLAERIARRAVKELNAEITDPNKKFVQLFNESCDIPKTLSCHYEKQGRAQIVIETTGQRNIQPLHVRQNQIKKVIEVTRSALQI